MENKEILEMINQLDKQDFELSSDIKLLYDEIKNIEGSFDISGVEKEIETLKESISSIELQKGDKGDKGDKGKDGKDGKNGKDGTNGKDGLNGRDGIDGLNGKDGSPNTPEQIIEKINTLENVIELKTIKDFPKIEGTEDIKRQVDTIGNQVLRLLSKQQQSSGGGTWGSITGTLSNQLDLQNALNLKYDASNPAGYITTSALSGYLQNNVGIAGGTTLIGGTASGNNLTLVSTSNATKGKILFGNYSAYDGANNRLGIGTTTPANILSILGNSNIPGGVSFDVKNSNASGDTRFTLSNSSNKSIAVSVTGSSYAASPSWINGAFLFTNGGLSNMNHIVTGKQKKKQKEILTERWTEK